MAVSARIPSHNFSPGKAIGWRLEQGFAVITVCNPLAIDDREGDEMATIELRNLLSRRGLELHHVTEASPDLSQGEPGFGARGLTLEEALEIGQALRHYAIFWATEDGIVDVVS